MPDAVLTYARLGESLRDLGFGERVVPGKARVYRHAPTGATVVLPDSPPAEAVLPHHLIVVQAVLRDFNLADPTDPRFTLQRVS